MKRIQRTAMRLLMATMLFSPAAAVAQEPPPLPGSRPDRMRPDPIETLLAQKDSLQLTEDQVARLEQLGRQLETQDASLREELRRSRERVQQLRDSRRATVESARELLTDEQRAQLRSLMRDRMQERMRGRRGFGPGQPGARRPPGARRRPDLPAAPAPDTFPASRSRTQETTHARAERARS